MLDIRLEGKLPVYEQLCKGISEMISNGTLKADDKLPAVREVAKQLSVNPNTVQKAYAQLESAGLIYSIPAKGSYVSSYENSAMALKKEAVERLENALEEARRNGISLDEVRRISAEIWGEGND